MYKRMVPILMIAAALLVMSDWPASSDENCRTSKGALPAHGPRGGKIVKLDKHCAEVQVNNGQLRVHFLEPDGKGGVSVKKVAIAMELPGKPQNKLTVQAQGEGYTSNLIIPANARRATFYISCIIAGKKEKGRYVFEMNR